MSQGPVTCEVIAIGNELLIGDVQDTNTFWLIRQLTGLGGFVRRCTLVRDDFAAIAGALHASLQAEARLVITSGGLGPTADDLTLAAVASAFDLPLVVHEQAMAMLASRYADLARAGWVKSSELNDARRKMAMFPHGAEPIYNPIGGAPAATLRVGMSTIVCLPGVPAELKGIFTQSMQRLLDDLFGGAVYQIRSVLVDCRDESFMASQLQSVVERHPRVYLKSRAQRLSDGTHIKITLSATARDAPAVASLLDAAQSDLESTLAALGLNCQTEIG